MLYNQVCTVYNKYTENGVDKWQRTVLNNIFWSSSNNTRLDKYGKISDDKVSVVIGNKNLIVNRIYVKPLQFKKLSNSDRLKHWTLSESDIIVLGVVTDEITRGSDILDNYDDSYRITSVADYRDFGNLGHLRVGAK